MIFLDNASTTPCYQVVAENFAKNLTETYFNPSAHYLPSLETKNKIESSRQSLLSLLNAEGEALVFCGSATEANNMALQSGCQKGKKIVISEGEHPSIFECAKNMKQKGFDVEVCPLSSDGRIDETAFSKIDFSEVALVSIIHVNNETGAINDIKRLAKIAKQKNPSLLFHSDGVQAFGKIEVDFDDLGVDYYTISAHKIHGPKGIGALVAKKKVKLQPIIFGGGQESGKRSGTENVPAIIAFSECAKIKCASIESDRVAIEKVKQSLLKNLQSYNLPMIVNSPSENCSPYILSVSIEGLRGEVLVHALEKHQIYMGTGSACSSKKIENRILSSMGRNQSQIEGNIRISLSVQELDIDTKTVAYLVANEAQKLIK